MNWGVGNSTFRQQRSTGCFSETRNVRKPLSSSITLQFIHDVSASSLNYSSDVPIDSQWVTRRKTRDRSKRFGLVTAASDASMAEDTQILGLYLSCVAGELASLRSLIDGWIVTFPKDLFRSGGDNGNSERKTGAETYSENRKSDVFAIQVRLKSDSVKNVDCGRHSRIPRSVADLLSSLRTRNGPHGMSNECNIEPELSSIIISTKRPVGWLAG